MLRYEVARRFGLPVWRIPLSTTSDKDFRARGARVTAMSTPWRDEVARVAALARIDMEPDELDRLAGELEVIVEAVAKVSQVATPDVPATSHPLPLSNVFRADEPVAPLDRDEVLAMAPAATDGKFLVPQILGEDA